MRQSSGIERDEPIEYALDFRELTLDYRFPGSNGIRGAFLNLVRSTITLERYSDQRGVWEPLPEPYKTTTLQVLQGQNPDCVWRARTYSKKLRARLHAYSQRDREEHVEIVDEFQNAKFRYVDVEARLLLASQSEPPL